MTMSGKKSTGSFPAQSGYGRTRGRPCRQYVEIAVLGLAIALIWTALALPTIFYHLPVKEVTFTLACISLLGYLLTLLHPMAVKKIASYRTSPTNTILASLTSYEKFLVAIRWCTVHVCAYVWALN